METARVAAFRKWLVQSRTGSVYVYYSGELGTDRGGYILARNEQNEKEAVWVPNFEIDQLARAAIEAWKAERVHLFQRKLHDHEYEYIAMKRGPHQRPLWMPDGSLEIVSDYA